MEIKVKEICSPELKEVIFTDIGFSYNTGSLNEQDQIELARSLLYAADELLEDERYEFEKNKISMIAECL